MVMTEYLLVLIVFINSTEMKIRIFKLQPYRCVRVLHFPQNTIRHTKYSVLQEILLSVLDLPGAQDKI